MIGSRARGALDDSFPGRHWEGWHDLTDGRSLVCIAGELREREAARRLARRRAWEARQRFAWLRRAARAVVSILRRPDRAPAGRPEPPARGFDDPGPETPDLPSVWEALTHAQVLARRAGHRELSNALHAVLLLDMTGNLSDMAPLVRAVSEGLRTALGDDPREVN